MRRRRNSKASDVKRDRDESGEVSHILQNYSGPSFSTLPREIHVDVLVRLSVKRILVYKSVCKTLFDLISGHEFAKFHFEKCQVYPLIRFPSLPNVVYLMQPEKDEFDLKLDMCDHTGVRLGCACNVNVELDTKFVLPMYNQCVTDDDDEDRSKDALDSNSEGNGITLGKLDLEDKKYGIVNSCNGLLCLSGPSDNNPLIVCNPVIGEFMKLPVPKTIPNVHVFGVHYGLSFSPATNQYKVIRTCQCWFADDKQFFTGFKSQVIIPGSQSWKDIGSYLLDCKPIPPTYMNGFLFWFSKLNPVSIFFFDTEKESFGAVAAPPVENTSDGDYENVGMGVLGEELCMTSIGKETDKTVVIDVWVMKDCGTKKEWSKVFSFDLYSNLVYLGGLYRPIKYLNHGALLMSQTYQDMLLYKDPRKNGFKCLKLPLYRRAEVIAHTPSFVSLKQSLSEHTVKVLKVKSRCAGLELHSEGNGISIVEKEVMSDWDMESDSEDRDSGSDSEDGDIGLKWLMNDC